MTEGCTISTWYNSGTLGALANAITGYGTVTYNTLDRINGNPTLLFNNASLNTNHTLGIANSSISIFAVTRIANTGTFLIGTQSGVTGGVSWSTSNTFDQF